LARANATSSRPSFTVIGGVLLLMAALWVARSVFIPIALAVLLTFILTPAVMALQRRGLPRLAAVLLVTGLTLSTVAGGIVIISKQLHDLAATLPRHRENIASKIRDIQGEGPSVLDNLMRMMDEITREIKPPSARSSAIKVEVVEGKTTGMSLFPYIAMPLIGVIGSISLIVGLTVSMLFKREDLRNRVISLIGKGQLTSTTRALDEGAQRISRYLIIHLSVNASFGFLFGLGLKLIGVEYAFLWGVMAAILRFIPFIGTWLGGIFPILISVATFTGWLQPILVVVILVSLGLTANNVIEPMLISRSTGVSPVALVVAAAFWTWLWGPIGLVLSTPMTVCLRVIGKYVPQLEFFDVLLGTDPALDPEYGYYQRLLARDEDEAEELVETYLAQHTVQELADDVLVPTLSRTRTDQDRGDLSDDDVRFILHATQDVLDGLPLETLAEEGIVPAPVKVVCIPVRDDIDELALHLFHLVLGPFCQIEMLSPGTVSTSLAEWVRQEQPALVLIGCVPPGGTARVRYLCKQLRRQFPELPIAVGCWGLGEEGKLGERLRAAGASQVGATMKESLEELAPLLQLLPQMQPADSGDTTDKTVTQSV
jgi:predicted PurR-regulated permease PerM